MKNRLFLAAAASVVALVAVIGVTAGHQPEDHLAVAAGSASDAVTPPPSEPVAPPAEAPQDADAPVTTTTTTTAATRAPIVASPSPTTSTTLPADPTSASTPTTTPPELTTETTASPTTTTTTGPWTWVPLVTGEAVDEVRASELFEVTAPGPIRFHYQLWGDGEVWCYLVPADVDQADYRTGKVVFHADWLTGDPNGSPSVGDLPDDVVVQPGSYYLVVSNRDGKSIFTANEYRPS